MSEVILFNLGLPFGGWPAVAAALGTAQAQGTQVVHRLHDELFEAPPLDGLTVAQAGALQAVVPDAARLAAWLAEAPHLPSLTDGDARLCWTAAHLAQGLPQARFLVWVEHPAHACGARLTQAGGNFEVQLALALLRSAALGLLQLLQRYPEQCLVVALDESRFHPAAFADKLSEWLGKTLPAVPAELPASVTLPEVDALALTLAARCVANDRALVRAQERMFGSCVLLSEAAPAGQPIADPGNVTWNAVRDYVSLVQRASAIDDHHRQRLVLAEAELARSAEKRDSAIKLCEQLQSQLHETQEELEAAFLQERKIAAQLSAVSSGGHSVQTEIEKGRQQAAQWQSRSESVEKEKGDLLLELESAHVQVTALNRQNDLLMVQLHQVQEELEHYYLACQALESEAMKPRRGHGALKIGRFELDWSREDGPHRELALVLHEVHAADRVRGRVAVRIVEHHGRPGIAFFNEPDAGTALLACEPTGQEAGRAFILLVPEDDPSRLRLQHLGAGDWHFVQGVAEAVAGYLETASGGSTARWRVVAQRLVKSLAALPARFRFDEIHAVREASSETWFRVRFQNVLLGGEPLHKLELRWRPAPTPRIELLAPDQLGDMSLFGFWPVDEGGEWCAQWQVPLASNDVQSARRTWRAMSNDDRRNLLGVLEALPAAAQHAEKIGLQAQLGGAAPLHASAAALLREAQRFVYGSRLRRVWNAARGRIAW